MDTLRSLRLAAGFQTQGELALAADVESTTVSQFERGQNVNPLYATVDRLARVLGVPTQAVYRAILNTRPAPKGPPRRRRHRPRAAQPAAETTPETAQETASAAGGV